MLIQRLVISALAIIASCHASGIGHLAPVVKSFPIVRYAPFFSFPNAGRSIHAIAPAIAAPASAPVFPASAPAFAAPAFPAPAFPAPVFPAPALPPPAFPAPAIPAPVFHAPAVAPAPVPLPASVLPAPVHFTPQPFFAPSLPRLAPLVPALPKFAPIVPAYPQAHLYARTLHALPTASFSPIIRPALAPAVPAPFFGPAPVAVAKALPFSLPAYAPHLPYPHAPLVKQVAWK